MDSQAWAITKKCTGATGGVILEAKSIGRRPVISTVLAIKPNREFPRTQLSGAHARMDCNVQTKR
jgi:hypothetical protein